MSVLGLVRSASKMAALHDDDAVSLLTVTPQAAAAAPGDHDHDELGLLSSGRTSRRPCRSTSGYGSDLWQPEDGVSACLQWGRGVDSTREWIQQGARTCRGAC